ncbi:hypothetical protein PAXRUDRAFT_824509 [Paxillus rubicundulus Ve08.2h10]|uniref:Uncharacterized protein n=1 Tax=Paxillus rubicundulus Ve08.2h10 TaxID=930991 RepID=A0A0D0DUB2_9AGAM|nr:hypothetical protein PAXRUDRAFT_824509 [Paxillus rubicundulus Ve08.2h10]
MLTWSRHLSDTLRRAPRHASEDQPPRVGIANGSLQFRVATTPLSAPSLSPWCAGDHRHDCYFKLKSDHR